LYQRDQVYQYRVLAFIAISDRFIFIIHGASTSIGSNYMLVTYALNLKPTGPLLMQSTELKPRPLDHLFDVLHAHHLPISRQYLTPKGGVSIFNKAGFKFSLYDWVTI
jgi:hypothetical protein